MTSSLICAVGDTHGRLDEMYRIVAELEEQLGRFVDFVVQVGDFGFWPDPNAVDAPTLRHGGAGDFPRWLAEGRSAPRPTVAIAGNHEDFHFLADLPPRPSEVLGGLTYLPSGQVHTVELPDGPLRIGAVGGCYGPSDFPREVLHGLRRRHFNEAQLRSCVSRAAAVGGLDLLLLHDAPAGPMTGFPPPGRSPRSFRGQSEELGRLVGQVRPALCLHGHFHARFERRVSGVRTVGLAQVAAPGCAIVFERAAGTDGALLDVAEWRRPADWPTQTPDPDPAALWGATFEESEVPEIAREMEHRLQRWSDAVLQGRPMIGRERRQVHKWLPDGQRRRRLLMAALRGRDLARAVTRLLGEGVTVPQLEDYISAAPEPAEVRSVLGRRG